MRRTTSGWLRFHTSGGSPNWRPSANSMVPIAPSASTGWPESMSVCQRSVTMRAGYPPAWESDREEAIEERAVAADGLAEILGRHVVVAGPARLETLSLAGEALG